MSVLNDQQQQRALEAMRQYLAAGPIQDGKTPVQTSAALDEQRAALIDNELKPLVQSYLDGDTALATFKSKVDGINKRNCFWGFKGIKGQMFFNMVVNVADDPDECDQEIKAAIAVPTSIQIASRRRAAGQPCRSDVVARKKAEQRREYERQNGVEGRLSTSVAG